MLLELLNKLSRDKQSDTDKLSRVHIDNPMAPTILAKALRMALDGTSFDSYVVLCIGTDRSTGDALGPLVGTKLKSYYLESCKVYGTLDDPVHATNLNETIEFLSNKHEASLILAVDACLGRTENVGYINMCKGPLKPGTGVNKTLPEIGHFHITGVVNVGGFMEYLVLQNPRLNLVMRMADTISKAFAYALTPRTKNLIHN
jgi:putative sporulation protein YyaC